LIENVDGVLQENCNNKILSIQDDSSFENLIMSMVLSEMGVTTNGADSLESILANQADSTDVATFEDFLLEALQDELDLGDTDLSMQEMLDLLEDPSLAALYDTSNDYSKPSQSSSSSSSISNTVSDYDNDGIPDYRDECMYIKENYNGYEDTDGCLDFKPLEITPTVDPKIDDLIKELKKSQSDAVEAAKAKQAQEAFQKQLLRQEVLVLQKQSYDKLEILKNDISVSEESLKQISSNSDEQKKILDKAWDLLKTNKAKLDKITNMYKVADIQIGSENYANAKFSYNSNEKDAQQIGNYLKEISKLIDEAQKIKPKTCFLWWCW